MTAIRRILAAVKDPGARRLPGVRKAARLAAALGAELVLYHALAEPLYVGGVDGDLSPLYDKPPDIEQRIREAQRARLERIARRLRRTGLKVSVSAEWDYPAYEAIVREACRVGAGLIVAEQHPGRHLAAGLLHLNDWELLRLSPMPVLLVKQSRPFREPVILAAVDPDHTYAKPMRLNQQILRLGAAVARALRGALHAGYAYVPLPLTAFSGGALSDEEVRGLEARAARSARAKLQRTVRGVAIPRARQHILGRHPVDAIAQLATRTRSSIVVMGAISRSGLKRLLIGNTAERVLDRLNCDVLIVKPAGLVKPPARSRRGARYFGIQPRLY
ncbi:MAG TPA: universal stress protein [Steroidobacteraceae bacterium]|nr:universal stress protein [Steroidobacteraceae bacterium]